MTKTDIEVNITLAPCSFTNEAITPPAALAKKAAIIQTPIKIPAKRGGDNLVTIDNPTGDKHSSPTVCVK